MSFRKVLFTFGLGFILLAGCTVKEAGNRTETNSKSDSEAKGDEPTDLSGAIQIDGSSTVYPVSQAVAEEFQKKHTKTRVEVSKSGTGGGFKKFVLGEIDINDASRPIKDSEKVACEKNGVLYIELKVAIDGLSVVVNSQNDFCKQLTIADLNKLWDAKTTVSKWSDLDPAWPAEEIKLYGPDTDSGTFDYFTETVNGESGKCRSDYTPSTEDNVLVRGVAGDKYSIGYFGYSYYIENKDQLHAVAISPTDSRADGVLPTTETIENGSYSPLSRPLFIYVSEQALRKPQIVEYLRYYLSEEHQLVEEAGYISLTGATLTETRQQLEAAIQRANSSK